MTACHKKNEQISVKAPDKPQILESGRLIQFTDLTMADYFKVQTITKSNIQAELTAPARVVATIVKSQENPGQNLVLFDNPDLTANYSSMLQHIINISRIQNVNIRQKRIELERAKDLQVNGAASGREVLEAQTELAMEETNLANEKAAALEHEARLKLGGFNPEQIIHAKANSVWLICDIPEDQINKIKKSSTCEVMFTSFPDKKFIGNVEDVGDVVDNITRMVKLRISLANPESEFRAGMFAIVEFGVTEGVFLSVPKESVVVVQGKKYVFVKKDKGTFERREVMTGQQIGERILIFKGLEENETVAVSGAMQLKGLSFGY
jgi:multidrug efflux pump subunit AcrA (membrane-fusion protein)